MISALGNNFFNSSAMHISLKFPDSTRSNIKYKDQLLCQNINIFNYLKVATFIIISRLSKLFKLLTRKQESVIFQVKGTINQPQWF